MCIVEWAHMNYAELTPSSRSRYDGGMDVPTPEQGRQSQVNQHDGLSEPPSAAAKSLRDNQEREGETEAAPANAETSIEQVLRAKKDEAQKTPLTRDKLTEFSETLQYSSSAADVYLAAEFVVTAIDVLRARLAPEANPEQSAEDAAIFKELKEKNVFDRATGVLDD